MKIVEYELCKGGKCCPVFKKVDNNTYILEEEGIKIYLQPEHLKSLYKIIKNELKEEEND